MDEIFDLLEIKTPTVEPSSMTTSTT